jgi:hypothetical protein
MTGKGLFEKSVIDKKALKSFLLENFIDVLLAILLGHKFNFSTAKATIVEFIKGYFIIVIEGGPQTICKSILIGKWVLFIKFESW